jgi:hypothetical protein
MRVYGSSISTAGSTLETGNAEEPQYEAHVLGKMDTPRSPAPTANPRKGHTDSPASSVSPKSPNGIDYSRTVIVSSAPVGHRPPKSSMPRATRQAQATLSTRRKNLKKMLMMQGYPLIYIVLWIPGITNRLWESIAGKSPLWLQALQASTQYIGLGNTITYAWNEQLYSKVRAELGRPRAGFHTV